MCPIKAKIEHESFACLIEIPSLDNKQTPAQDISYESLYVFGGRVYLCVVKYSVMPHLAL